MWEASPTTLRFLSMPTRSTPSSARIRRDASAVGQPRMATPSQSGTSAWCRRARYTTRRLTVRTPTSAAALNGFDQRTSNYHGMDVSLTKRGRVLTYKANYTWSKIMDLNSAILAPSAGNEPSNLYSPYYRRQL